MKPFVSQLSAYGDSYKHVRSERMKFANRECELALFGREHCKRYRLECHHKDSESYVRCRQGVATLNDVIILCKACHDIITNLQRGARYAGTPSLRPTPVQNESMVRENVERTKIQVDRYCTSSYEECSNYRPAQ